MTYIESLQEELAEAIETSEMFRRESVRMKKFGFPLSAEGYLSASISWGKKVSKLQKMILELKAA